MLVTQILKSKGDAVFTAAPNETLGALAGMLNARKVGALVVLDQDRVVGIVSERDVIRAVAEAGAEALSRPLSEFMTKDVIFAEPGDTVDSVLGKMTDRRIRHLPVCKDDRLVGIVSIGDLVKSKIGEVEAEADGLRAYIAAS
ncbi:MAG: CBS domain-containing protein [Phenylobacterium sp.]|jgi:CBS domain-containing protein|uniref:CBS domain-containing protein n=1 Tax=Phenylobacterium sp. TaxID=1871053 RepID=UPI002A368312|nr:CBS domain-containing protein [Phenylobacterium sp.]MDX9997400.1 CBS domain-containing protein [Phenylobacterium sp.]